MKDTTPSAADHPTVARIQVKKNWHGAYNPIAEYERTPNIHTSEEFEPKALLNMSMPRIKLDSRSNNNARTHWFNLTDPVNSEQAFSS
jgi:hypothetical protein